MPSRLRHCIECPECNTRYLIGFSPYNNGSYLVSPSSEFLQEYKLVCSCCRPAVCSRWKSSELQTYGVSNQAFARGYGSADEVWLYENGGKASERFPPPDAAGDANRRVRWK
jgi:hypothetical protein